MKFDIKIILPIFLLLLFGVVILNSVSPGMFPEYYWFYLIGLFVFMVFTMFDFEIISAFSRYFYIFSIILLLSVLVIGHVTRGTVRWIPIGSFSLQPSEIVRPFLLVFFANYIASEKLSLKRLIKILGLMGIPIFLIFIQPSLGVSGLMSIGFLGLFLASEINKKHVFYVGLLVLLIIPFGFFLLAPYQKARILNFLNPFNDPQGLGYNAIQSMISVGSGKFLGRGLGGGIGTQLEFLPEKHTDFIFASIAEEMGFVGSSILLMITFYLFWQILNYVSNASSVSSRMFLVGFFLTIFIQVVVHVGMNMGLLPITGVPYPLVSSGGSSLLSTLISFGIVMGSKKR